MITHSKYPLYFITPTDSYDSEVIEDFEVDKEIMQMNLSDSSNDEEDAKALRDLLWKHRGMGSVKGVEYRIKMKEGAEPVFIPMRRRSSMEEEVERKEIKKILEAGILPWGALNVFVPKKDGVSSRTTLAFRKLNEITVTDVYPIEDVKTTLDWLSHKKIYFKFDLEDGFF